MAKQGNARRALGSLAAAAAAAAAVLALAGCREQVFEPVRDGLVATAALDAMRVIPPKLH